MSTLDTYTFTLVLGGVNEQTDGLEDALFNAGCDDALVNFRNGTVYLDFDREANSLEEAILSAIQAVEGLALNATVVSVAPDDFVSESEMAKRLELKRQAISLWVKGARCAAHPFPQPQKKLSAQSPLWRWVDVVKWLIAHQKIDDIDMLEKARLIEHINVILMERNQLDQQYKQQLMKKLKR